MPRYADVRMRDRVLGSDTVDGNLSDRLHALLLISFRGRCQLMECVGPVGPASIMNIYLEMLSRVEYVQCRLVIHGVQTTR